jgi:F-type H+-transporting ATPase subunit b
MVRREDTSRRDHDEARAAGTLRLCRRAIPLALMCLPLLPAGAFAAGMPQLDFSTPLTVSQVVWGAVIFVVLYVVLSRVGLPRVASVLEERAGHIHRDLEGARAAKTKADTDTEEAAAATAKARAEAQAAINAALEDAKKAAASQAEALNARLETRLQEAEAQIAQAHAAAMSALHQVATETATSIVTRLTGQPPAAPRLETAVNAALVARGVG